MHAVHPSIYRLHFGEQQPVRPWDVILLRDSVTSDFQWDGKTLTFRGEEILTLQGTIEAREVALADVPELKARSGDQLPPGPARQLITARFARDPKDKSFGLGQRVSSLRRDPGYFCFWTVDPPSGHHKAMHSLYQAQPVLLQMRPGRCLGIVLNSTWFSRIDVGSEHEDQIVFSTLGGQMELFVFLAATPREASELLARLTGHPLLPPTWALGFHQSRWGYREQSEIAELARQFRERRIPLDVVHLDIDYMDDFRSFSFHPERFPAPEELAADLRTQGIRLVTIIDPGVRADFESDYSVAREGTRHGHFIRHKDGSPFIGYCWPDAALFPDFAQPKTRQWWGTLQKTLLDRGISGVWIDMNEPAVFETPFSEGLSRQHPMPLGLTQADTVHAETHNLYGHQMAQATFEGLQALGQERPWVLTRSAFLGTQKYAVSWMGDNSSWWEHLELSLPQLLGMGLSGAPFVGVDIGGFFGNCHGELFARWMEAGVFYPFMRNHSAMGTRAQEPWSFGPEIEALVRRQIELRYQLLPYLETLSWDAHRHGWPILRPLFWEFPEDEESYLHETQAMFGSALMFAPVSKPGHTHRAVYFPPGRWYEFWSDEVVEGPAHRIWPAPLGQIPLFVREGACIPMGQVRQSSDEPVQLSWLCAGEPPGRGRYIDQEIDLSQQTVVRKGTAP
jgi:alpha-glucosidase